MDQSFQHVLVWRSVTQHIAFSVPSPFYGYFWFDMLSIMHMQSNIFQLICTAQKMHLQNNVQFPIAVSSLCALFMNYLISKFGEELIQLHRFRLGRKFDRVIVIARTFNDIVCSNLSDMFFTYYMAHSEKLCT